MITGVRSALLCERVEQDEDGGANYFNLCGATLTAESNPGFLPPAIASEPSHEPRPNFQSASKPQLGLHHSLDHPGIKWRATPFSSRPPIKLNGSSG